MRKPFAVAIAAATIPPLASAQTPFDIARDNGGPEGTASLSVVATSGNSDSKTASGAIEAEWEQTLWREQLTAEALGAQQNDETSAERYFTSAQLDRKLDEVQYLYLNGDYENDRFSGYEYRTGASVGYGRTLWDTDVFFWDAEIGPGVRYRKARDPDEPDGVEATVRAFSSAKWSISASAFMKQSLEVTAGDDSTIVKTETALATKVWANFATQIAYAVRHNTNTPEDVNNTDTELTASVVYGF